MVANGRRLAWVELAAGVVTVVALTPWSPAKRAAARAAVAGSPLARSPTPCWDGAPAPRSSSPSAPSARSSTRRRTRPRCGATSRTTTSSSRCATIPCWAPDYGHGYIEVVWLPDVSNAYALYRFLPHNSILGLWAFGGLVGFTALWAMLVVGFFLAARAYRHAVTVDDRTVALTAVAILVVYLVYCYGDLGLGTWTSVFTVAPALAIASKLAVTHRRMAVDDAADRVGRARPGRSAAAGRRT